MELRWFGVIALSALFFLGCDSDEGSAPDAEADVLVGGGGGGGGVGLTGGGGDAGQAGEAGSEAPAPACRDLRDNDGDGLIDLQDPGCVDGEDTDEGEPPQCNDGIDNDFDDLTDFPDDPGCASSVDEDEFNPPVTPQCNDGLDNDRDGAIDEIDPGCSSVADAEEGDEDEDNPPACLDAIDNDEDGVVDFPLDPGCSAAGDTSEEDPPRPPECINGLDDDGDGLIDYPDDPGCAGAGDREELDKGVKPECFDGLDNDRDGKIDYPDDDGCAAASDFSERGACGDVYDPPRVFDGEPIRLDTARGVFNTNGSCGGRGSPEVAVLYRLTRAVERLEISTIGETDVPTTLYLRRVHCLSTRAEVACQREDQAPLVPGHVLQVADLAPDDYYIFIDGVAGIGGPVELTVTEVPLAECLNRRDDDEDGRVDYPTDPGCESPRDRDERTPSPTPACANDEDDDGDGRVDYPLDPGCLSAASTSELDACGDGVAFHEYFFDDEAVYGETKVTQGATDAHEGSCGGRSKPEVIYYYHNPYNARLTFNTAHPETTTPTTLYIRRACDDAQSELRCDDGSRAGSTNGRFTLEQAAVGDYWIFVDTSVGTGGPFKLTVEVERLDPGCDDGLDNDRDGAIDGDDPGCASREDEDEGDETGVEVACSNGRDDDEDGRIDYPADPGCETLGDDDEADPEAPPACLNGLDDDADGLIDFPWDPGCFAAADDDEIDRRPTPECSNRLDDDRDGLIDFPFDPGCAGMGDRGEGEAVTACSDGEDNDGDGRIDFPWDPGCFAAGHASEVDPAILPACGDGEDNDEDGRVDFPFDPGCTYAADPDEADAPGRPICANERDDDRDGRTDFPDDPGCAYAADTNETNPGPVLPRCADGVDNDWDGLIDLDDLGCGSGEDDDEADPPQTPACVNGIDDDGDGLTDYPADPGCLAPGDLTEESLCREGVTVETLRSDRVEGQTAEGDADQYEASCGGGGQPERVYRYVAAESGTLRVWLDAEGTDHPAILSVRADCESGATTLGCTHVAGEEISAEIEPGEYFIFVDGGAPLALTSLNEAITLPEEPVLIPEGNEPPIQPVEIRHDFEGCNGWNNDGGDAFDCYGDISVIYDGHVSGALDLPEDGEISGAAGDYRFSAHSDFPHPQVWRIQLRPEQPNDPRPVTARLLGNLGSGAVTRVIRGEHVTPLAAFPYVQTHDGPTRDVPALHFMVPSQISELGQIRYNIRDGFDEVEILAQGVHLPLTIYTVVSALTPAQLLPALMADLVEQPSVEGPYHGAFRLHVTQD